MTDPTTPRPRGRHSQPEAGSDAGRPAAELLAAWAGTDTLLADDGETMRPRRRRRHTAETGATDAQGLQPRSGVDLADVEITGLATPGLADVGLAAAALDLSAFGIDRAAPARRPTTPPSQSWGGARTGRPLDAAPRTTEMQVVPPAVPTAGDDRPTGRPPLDRRTAPSPRSAAEPTTADRVVADRYADADTDPGWLSATGRVAPVAAPLPAGPQADAPQVGAGSLAALFTGAQPVPSRHVAGPLTEPPTEVHAPVEDAAPHEAEHDAAQHDEYFDTGWEPATSRHRTGSEDADGDDLPEEHAYEPATDLLGTHTVGDHTGGLEVVGIVEPDDTVHDDLHDAGSGGGGGRGRRGGRGGGSGRSRRRRRPLTVVFSLLVLAGVVAGVVFGGQALWARIHPAAQDYAGAGTGSVDIRVNDGDSLRAIAGTLVKSDVIASTKPFTDAAKANAAATGIQPGVYSLHQQMSGKAALDLLLDPTSRQVTKVTVPEGLTAVQVLQRLSDQAGLPLDQLQAAAADPAAIGLPAYANGLVEGFLFPATYDIEPGDTAAQVLTQMVAGTVAVLDKLQVPVDQRLSVLTEASIVQAEAGSVEDMGKVARVLDNRIADGMPLQLDTTVNYANNKSGLTTTSEDRQNPSPYNTYVHTGLPPGAIGNPGEEAIQAVLTPTPGDWLFFVVVDPDTGETRFAVTLEEHNQNVALFQQWLKDHPGN